MSFKHVHLTIFDQLVPKIANYWKKEEVEALLNSLPANKIYNLYHIKDYSWTAVINKK